MDKSLINHRIKISLVILKRDGGVYRIKTTKKRRFLSKVQAVSESEVELYKLSVSYGNITSVEHKKVLAKNEGEYLTLKDLLFAFHIFTDPKEVKAIVQASFCEVLL